MLTTLRPTPPVAPATNTTSEVSIFFIGSRDVGFVIFSIRNSKNFTEEKTQLSIALQTLNYKNTLKNKEEKEKEPSSLTLAGDGGPLKKYSVLTNLPKSQDCRPISAYMDPLDVLEETADEAPCERKGCSLSLS